jgi:hypothetical protein
VLDACEGEDGLRHVERVDVPFLGDERTMLEAGIDFHRATVRLKCAGLSEEDAWRAPLPRSPMMTPGGVVSHLIMVEWFWVEYVVAGVDAEWPWSDGDPDIDFRRKDGESLESLLTRYTTQCQTSRELMRKVSPDSLAARQRTGSDVAVRHVYVQLIQETARHNGHLDAMREILDGVVGE